MKEVNIGLLDVIHSINQYSCPNNINFHMHTTCSDGSLSPLELLNQAGWIRQDGNQWLTNEKNEIFEFEFLTDPYGPRIYTTFQEDLKNVGIKMNFKQVDGSTKFSKTMSF